MTSIYKKLFLGVFLLSLMITGLGGKAEAGPKYILETVGTPSSYRQTCNAGTPVDFAVRPSDINLNLDTGLLTYNINVEWRRCPGGQDTRAYAVYSDGPEICPYSGIYGASSTGWVTDCVKYVGAPPYSGPGNGLTCWGGTNEACVTGSFTGARRSENQPPYGFSSISIPMSKANELWAVAEDNGTWTVTQRMCQYYKTGNTYQINNNDRCVDVSISVTWGDTDPTATDFNLTPLGQTVLNDKENPTQATFSSIGAVTDGTVGVKKVTVSRKYIVKKNDGTEIELTPPPSPASREMTINPTETYISNIPEVRPVSGLGAGDQVCVVVKLSPLSGIIDAGGNIQTKVEGPPEEFCDTLVNRPFLSFYGGDVSVGSGFGDGCTVASGAINTYNKGPSALYKGSGAQLAVRAFGSIQAGSGEGFTSSSYNAGLPKGLTFANSVGGTYGGNFASGDCMPDYFANSDGLTPSISGSVDLSSLDGGNYLRNTNVSLSGDLRPNQRYNLFVDGDLTIADNINYDTSSWANYASIPSLHVYVRGNINISPNVTNITGMFVAQPRADGTRGIINTCSGGTQGTNGTCNDQLNVNGSLSARRVDFRKVANSLRDDTKPSNASSNAASELFIFSPEQWIIRPGRTPGESNSSSKYDYFTVLPPLL